MAFAGDFGWLSFGAAYVSYSSLTLSSCAAVVCIDLTIGSDLVSLAVLANADMLDVSSRKRL